MTFKEHYEELKSLSEWPPKDDYDLYYSHRMSWHAGLKAQAQNIGTPAEDQPNKPGKMKSTCGDCDHFKFVPKHGDKATLNCEIVGYGTKADNNPCDRFEPDKVKPLAQYLDEYVEHEVDLDNIESADMYAYNSWRQFFKQALDAYELTENVKIRIERV